MNDFEPWIYVQHKHFNVGKMLLVKNMGNGWYGVRYLADGRVLVYSEYHQNELEVYIEPPTQNAPDFIFA